MGKRHRYLLDTALDYPENLYNELFRDKTQALPYNDDIGKRLIAALDKLPPRYKLILEQRYMQKKFLEDCGSALGVTKERARQMTDKAIAILSKQKTREVIMYGLDEAEKIEALRGMKISLVNIMCDNPEIISILDKHNVHTVGDLKGLSITGLFKLYYELGVRRYQLLSSSLQSKNVYIPAYDMVGLQYAGTMPAVNITELDLPQRAVNGLHSRGCTTTRDIIPIYYSGELLKTRNIGAKTYYDIFYALDKRGLILRM